MTSPALMRVQAWLVVWWVTLGLTGKIAQSAGILTTTGRSKNSKGAILDRLSALQRTEFARVLFSWETAADRLSAAWASFFRLLQRTEFARVLFSWERAVVLNGLQTSPCGGAEKRLSHMSLSSAN